MSVEYPYHDHRPGRLGPARRRPVDRAEDAVLWLLLVLALVVAVVSVVTGVGEHETSQARAAVQTAQRHPVQAELLSASGVSAMPDGISTMSAARVPARWTAPDGSVRTEDVIIPAWLPAGATTTVWVDRTGALTDPPLTPVGATVAAWLRGIGTLVIGWAVLLGCWAATRWITGRVRSAAWARQWALVEPTWSGRRRT